MTRPKVVVARDLGPDVMPLLHQREDLDVCFQLHFFRCEAEFDADLM